MLIQRAGTGTLPPPGFTTPPWEILTQQWNSDPTPLISTVVLGPATVPLGREDSESDDNLDGVTEEVSGHMFGWDNESPRREYEVGAFRIEWRPVSNQEYETFWRENGACSSQRPGSWVEEEGEIKVCFLTWP